MLVSKSAYFNKARPEDFMWLDVPDYKTGLIASFIAIEINGILSDKVIKHEIKDIKVRELRYILNYIAKISKGVNYETKTR